MPTSTMTKEDLSIWTWMVSRGMVNSLAGLSKMIGEELRVTSLDLRQYPVEQAASLLGGGDNHVVGINLGISGDASGNIMLIHEPKTAFDLIDIQLEKPLGSTRTLNEMELSVLGEMGNVTGSLFLNELADTGGLTLAICPPNVMIDKAEKVLTRAIGNIVNEDDHVFVIRATFCNGNREIDGTFMLLPTAEFIDVVLAQPKAQATRMEYQSKAMSQS